MGHEGDNALLSAVREAFHPGEKVVAAVSGGVDSVALLMLLDALAKEKYITLAAAHFEHGLRGEASVGDMRHVEELCRLRGIPFYAERGNVALRSAELRKGIEETARDMRRDFLERVLRESGSDVIALAHHADDQAETVLMHLMRGSGGAGAAGMFARRGIWVRPLLRVRKKDLIAYLKRHEIIWREDATNMEDFTPRNALRLHVMPEIEKIWPGYAEALTRFAHQQAVESRFLENCVDEWLGSHSRQFTWGQRLDIADPPDSAVYARALKRMLGKRGEAIDIERIAALNSGKKYIPRSDTPYIVMREGEELYFLQADIDTAVSAELVPAGVTELLPFGFMICAGWEGDLVRNDPFTQVLALEACEGARMRLWREGDRICPLGMGGKSKLLSDIYSQKQIPVPLRKFMPVLEGKDGSLLWAVGACISEQSKVKGNENKLLLHWQEGEKSNV